MEDTAIKTLLYIAAGGVVLVVIAFAFGKKDGSKDKQEEEKAQKLNAFKAFTNFKFLDAELIKRGYKPLPVRVAVNKAMAEKVAADIINAVGVLNDNEAAIYNAFKNVKSFYDLAYINLFFEAMMKDAQRGVNAISINQFLTNANLLTLLLNNKRFQAVKQKTNILDFLEEYMNTSERAKVYDIVKNIPIAIINGFPIKYKQ